MINHKGDKQRETAQTKLNEEALSREKQNKQSK
jgi:hypothetical protein